MQDEMHRAEVAELVNKANKLRLGGSFEDDPLITCLTTPHFDRFIQDSNYHVFLMIYNSEASYFTGEQPTGIEAWHRLASELKELIPDLSMACFDLGLARPPNMSDKEYSLLQEVTLKQPTFTLFPRSNKKGLRYSFEQTFDFMKRFVCQKCLSQEQFKQAMSQN